MLRFRIVLLLLICGTALSVRTVAQSYPPVFKTTSSYAEGDLVQYAGNTFRAVKAVAPSAHYPTMAYSSWELNYVRANTSLLIGSAGLPDLKTAWSFILNAKVADGAYLHLMLAGSIHNAYSESFTLPFSLNHSSGANISILVTNSYGATLTFSGSSGLVLSSGHVFSGILGGTSGLNIASSKQSPGYGIQINGNSTVTLLSNVSINGFNEGLEVGSNSSATAESLSVEGAVNAVEALYGGYVAVRSLVVTGASNAGLEAVEGTITAPNLAIDIKDGNFGVHANDSSFVDVSGASFTGNSTAILCSNHSMVKAEGATFTSNMTDVDVESLSEVDGIGASLNACYVSPTSLLLTEDDEGLKRLPTPAK